MNDIAHKPNKDELLRLDELSKYRVVMNQPETAFDEIARLAAIVINTPLAGVSLVDHKNIWIKGRVGIDFNCLSREGAFCSYAVESNNDMFIVNDTLKDLRFISNPLVAYPPFIRFYAAATLLGQRSYRLGTLWVMDTKPRSPSLNDRNALLGLAAQVVNILELRYHHPLSKLANRGAFIRNLQCSLNQQRGNEVCRLADCIRKLPDNNCLSEQNIETCVVGYIHLRKMHLIRSAYGRELVEKLILDVSRTLTLWVGKSSMLAQMENDDFGFALYAEDGNIKDKFADLQNLLSRPILIDGSPIHLDCSIGLSYFPESGHNASALLDQAANAALETNHPGFASIRTYESRQREEAFFLSEFERSIANDLKNKRFYVQYQPQIDIKAGKIIGLEALARLKHPNLGMISPSMFIPFAENLGLVFQLDIMILDNVCEDLRNWLDSGVSVVCVAVNLSRTTLLHPMLISSVANILKKWKISPHLIKLEITESGFSDVTENLLSSVERLHDQVGFKISIDDFGTGFSNLSALKTFKFDQLKADRQYVHGVSINHYVSGILQFIKGISEIFEVELLCEGVENIEDINWLLSHGFYHVQGWYFSSAVDAKYYPIFLRRINTMHNKNAYTGENHHAQLAACFQL